MSNGFFFFFFLAKLGAPNPECQLVEARPGGTHSIISEMNLPRQEVDQWFPVAGGLRDYDDGVKEILEVTIASCWGVRGQTNMCTESPHCNI